MICHIFLLDIFCNFQNSTLSTCILFTAHSKGFLKKHNKDKTVSLIVRNRDEHLCLYSLNIMAHSPTGGEQNNMNTCPSGGQSATVTET